MRFSLQSFLELIERLQAAPLELAHPAVVDLVDRNWIEEVQLLAAAPRDGHEVRGLELVQVLCHGLARHVELAAELGQRESAASEQPIEELASSRIGERPEDEIHDGMICK